MILIGEGVEGWRVEVDHLRTIYEELAQCIGGQDDNSIEEDCLLKAIPYWQKSIQILESWIPVSWNPRNEEHGWRNERMYHLFHSLHCAETNIAAIFKCLKKNNKVQDHMELAVSHAKKMQEGEEKTKLLFDALNSLGDAYHKLQKLSETKAVREEAYECLTETYDVDHPLVLEAGRQLVEILSVIGDYYDSERFARVCYESQTRAPFDPESLQAAFAASNLAIASCNLIKSEGPESADIEEALMLARKAVYIMKKLGDPGDDGVRWSFGNLVIVIFQKGDFGHETMKLFEDFLSDAIKNREDDANISAANSHLGSLHYALYLRDIEKVEHLLLSESYCKEALTLRMRYFKEEDLVTSQLATFLSNVTKVICRG
jgi:tetratricopeptide (TPR) repeat protein